MNFINMSALILFQKILPKVSPIFFSFFSDKESTKVLCEFCAIDDEYVEATHFCKTCDDPDPWCGTCANHHLKHKLSKDHELCADIKQFPNKEQKEWYLEIVINIKFVCDQFYPKCFEFVLLTHINN